MGLLDRFKIKKKPDKKAEDKEEKKVQAEAKSTEYASLRPKVEGTEELGIKEKGIKVKKSKKEDTKNAYNVLLKPLVTEKATFLASQNKYYFAVSKKANKIEIKRAIKSLYGVEPLDVNIINVLGKKVRYGRTAGKKKNWKKAIITLKEGDKIEVYEGV